MGRFWLLAVALNWGAWGEEFTKNQPYWKVPQAQTLRGHGSPYAKSAEVAEFPEGFLLKGLGVVQDKAGLHWARVEYAPGRTCFVRADSQHLQQTYDEPVGAADKNGDWPTRSSHRYWEVVDSGSGDLNGRMDPGYLADGQRYPKRVGSWPVVCTFPQGTILKTMPGMRGARCVTDDQRKNWLIVFRPTRGYCAVRLNSAFIRPVAGPFRPLKT